MKYCFAAGNRVDIRTARACPRRSSAMISGLPFLSRWEQSAANRLSSCDDSIERRAIRASSIPASVRRPCGCQFFVAKDSRCLKPTWLRAALRRGGIPKGPGTLSSLSRVDSLIVPASASSKQEYSSLSSGLCHPACRKYDSPLAERLLSGLVIGLGSDSLPYLPPAASMRLVRVLTNIEGSC